MTDPKPQTVEERLDDLEKLVQNLFTLLEQEMAHNKKVAQLVSIIAKKLGGK